VSEGISYHPRSATEYRYIESASFTSMKSTNWRDEAGVAKVPIGVVEMSVARVSNKVRSISVQSMSRGLPNDAS
jgi:hypothetical protein